MKKKIIFMGTPIFAAGILEHLIENGENVIGVVSQPDRKVGRKKEIKHTPVKEVSIKYDIPTFQPEKIREDLSFFYELKPDLIITAAFGQIVPQELLDIPPLGCINVHGSLLPKFRGGAPIHYSIITGEKETGVTIMEMVKKMDAGAMISQRAFPIGEDDTLDIVHDNMAEIGKELLIDTLPSIYDESYTKVEQNEDDVTYSPNIKPEEEKVDWSRDGQDIYNLIRGLNPCPVAYSEINGKRFKFFTTRFLKEEKVTTSGSITEISKDGIKISVNGGYLLVSEFQIEGKKRTNSKDFVNGNTHLNVGDKFNI